MCSLQYLMVASITCQVESLQADCDFTKEQLAAMKGLSAMCDVHAATAHYLTVLLAAQICTQDPGLLVSLPQHKWQRPKRNSTRLLVAEMVMKQLI